MLLLTNKDEHGQGRVEDVPPSPPAEDGSQGPHHDNEVVGHVVEAVVLVAEPEGRALLEGVLDQVGRYGQEGTHEQVAPVEELCSLASGPGVQVDTVHVFLWNRGSTGVLLGVFRNLAVHLSDASRRLGKHRQANPDGPCRLHES